MIHKHFKGNYYLRLFTTLSGDNLNTKYIHYLPLYLSKNYQIFTRTEEDFYKLMQRDHYIGTRFTEVNLFSYLKSWF